MKPAAKWSTVSIVAVVALVGGMISAQSLAEEPDHEEAVYADPVGRWQSYFNTPNADNGYVDDSLRDRLVSYIENSVDGSEIHGHITTLALPEVVDALVDAAGRDVDIWMVHNGAGEPHEELEAALPADRYVFCSTPDAEDNTACLSNLDDGTHHMKNWYFSHVEIGDDVYEHMVTTSSYNITNNQASRFNDMLVVSGNEELYDAHIDVYSDYLEQNKTDDRHSEPGGQIFVPSAATYTADFSPQKDGDMVADSLSDISEFEEGCHLRVANLNLTRSAVINELIRISEMGCEVQVATGTELTEDNKDRLDDAEVQHRHVYFEHDGGDVSLHNKMMVYNGFYDTPVDEHPTEDRMWVWTGSQNLTMNPLRFRDDVFVGVSRQGVYDNYSAHFDEIWAAGS